MRSFKVYVAGKVTGLSEAELKENFERGAMLAMKNGWDFCLPTSHVPSDADTSQAMKICIPLLADCDAILLLNGWEFSEGARIEKATAAYCGKKIFFETDLN